MKKIFIDGSAGTTGLRIFERIKERNDLELITLSEELRKDLSSRKKALNECDIAFLCLPDAASIEAVGMIENENVIVLDTSTAHRTEDGWTYGFPEIFENGFEKISKAKRIAVPGCHASGFIALVRPLIEKGILSKDVLLTCHSITGYSGGGKKMIAEYESPDRASLLSSPRQYGISQSHKHLREMKAVSKISNEPLFSPIVADFYSGMEVTVPLFAKQLESGFTLEDIKAVYSKQYNSKIVHYTPNADEEGFLAANAYSGKDSMQISVNGNNDRFILTARYDNLGKGASGAALECMNIVLGKEPEFGLNI